MLIRSKLRPVNDATPREPGNPILTRRLGTTIIGNLYYVDMSLIINCILQPWSNNAKLSRQVRIIKD